LTLAARRRVNYGNVAPREAQEMFVREALIEGRSRLRAPFLAENRALRAQVERLEAKIRRRDIMIDEQAQSDFYLSRLPPDINSVAAMERWLKDPANRHGAALKMMLSDLTRRPVDDVTAARYPDKLDVGGNLLPLEYRFESLFLSLWSDCSTQDSSRGSFLAGAKRRSPRCFVRCRSRSARRSFRCRSTRRERRKSCSIRATSTQPSLRGSRVPAVQRFPGRR
jgi:hypothetical protein